MKSRDVLFFFLSLFAFLISNLVLSQKEPEKFGRIDKKILEMTRYEADTNASAVILFDVGKSYFEYAALGRYRIQYERHVRVKVFDKEGYDWADWSIPITNGAEKISEIKGVTFNLVNGEIVTSKLKWKDIYEEVIYKDFVRKKFAMPNVKVGSVIDLKYSITSYFIILRDWYFQYDIPVILSKFETRIPLDFGVKKILTGYIPMNKYENKILINETLFSFQVFDVPAFKEEPPMTSKENYISKVSFTINNVMPVPGIEIDYATTWDIINKKLLENKYFGTAIDNNGRFLENDVNKILKSCPDKNSRMEAAYNSIVDKMEWNKVPSIYVNTTLHDAYDERTGNYADINLMLVLMLRKLGIKADPVILRKRSKGRIRDDYPSLRDVNLVIVCATIDSTRTLMDATTNYLPCGILPERDLNNKGWIVSWKNKGWVDLSPTESYKFLSMNTITMNENGVFTGSIQRSYKGYAAYDYRKKLSEYNANDDYISDIEDKCEGLKITKYTIENVDDLKKPVKEKFEVNISDQSEDAGNMIYFSPLFYQEITENPFKLKKRVYPVEYPYKKELTLMLNFTIPEGYTVEEVPENILVKLPDNGGMFLYKITKAGQVLQVITKLNITKELFLPEDYETLKEFYNLIIAKHKEQIVIIKNM